MHVKCYLLVWQILNIYIHIRIGNVSDPPNTQGDHKTMFVHVEEVMLFCICTCIFPNNYISILTIFVRLLLC